METCKNKYGLIVPIGFKLPRNVERLDWAGTGKFGTWIVPDYICFISIKKSACIHDEMYGIGGVEEDKEFADTIFHENMLKQLEKCSMILRPSAIASAYTYYKAVVWFGSGSFNYHKKNEAQK